MRKIFEVMQRIGQALMIPVSALPAAGLLVALGRMLETGNKSSWQYFLSRTIYEGGLAIFQNLPVIFAIGVAIGFTGGAGTAGLAAAVGYFTLVSILKVITDIRALPLALDTGVFGGIVIGLIAAQMYHRYSQTKLTPVLGFFAGKRLVPIVTAVAGLFAALVLGVIWPPIQAGIHNFGEWVVNSPYGPAFYAAGKRALIPLGLHHVFYPPFLYQFGEFVTASKEVLHGETSRYFAGDPTAGKFMAAEFPLMLFGLPAAALAMFLRASPEKRKAVGGVMLMAALTSIITGITEPIEFSFIFVAPVLYVFHVGAAFLSGVLTSHFDIHLGYTFSASLIDYAVGFFNQKNSSWLFLVVGPTIAALYFLVFYFGIPLLKAKTPGREVDSPNDTLGAEITVVSDKYSDKKIAATDRASRILAALGGSENIEKLDACISRLRLSVKQPEYVNIDMLKQLGAAGVMMAGHNLQAVFGTESDAIKDEIQRVMAGGDVLLAPFACDMMALKDVPDATFADKILGDGVGLTPRNGARQGRLFSPSAGQIEQLFRTGHAVIIKTASGTPVMIHVGIDTVKMGGDGFTALKKDGDLVKAGEAILEFDLDKIDKDAKSRVTPMVFVDPEIPTEFDVINSGPFEAMEPLLKIRLKK